MDGTCVSNVPSSWTCAAQAWGDGVCDCGCGIADPDCAAFPPYTQSTCPSGQQCINGTCSPAPDLPPSSWICDPYWYDETRNLVFISTSPPTCDCGCGGDDPDCEISTNPISNCPCAGMNCMKGFCVGECDGYQVSLKAVPPSSSSTASTIKLPNWVVVCVLLVSVIIACIAT